MRQLRVKRLVPEAILPTRAHPPDAGLDLYTYHRVHIAPRGLSKVVVTVGLGIAVDIPHGYVGLIHPRSSIGAKGVIIPNAPGTIDSGYTGELKILLINVASNSWVTFSPGERIAQLIIQKVELPEVVEVDQIGYSIPEHRPNTCACELAHGLYGFRGSGGFGSTGK